MLEYTSVPKIFVQIRMPTGTKTHIIHRGSSANISKLMTRIRHFLVRVDVVVRACHLFS